MTDQEYLLVIHSGGKLKILNTLLKCMATDETEDSGQAVKKDKMVSNHQFYFETPLYHPIKSELFEENIYTGDVDGYSTVLHEKTTYTIDTAYVDTYSWKSYRKVILSEKRKDAEDLWFILLVEEDQVTKIGQYPSLATIQKGELGKKYDQLLSAGDLRELKKAIGLAAHSSGIGSYVHLRRIFENLIEETYVENEGAVEIEESKLKRLNKLQEPIELTPRQYFDNLSMEEKVILLEEYLPSQLVRLRKIYRILSMGIHELEEEECLEFYPALLMAITLILDQKIELQAKKEKDERAIRLIEEITEKISKDKSAG